MQKTSKVFSTIVVFVAYVVVALVGYYTYLHYSKNYDVFWSLALADVWATVALFIFSVSFRNSSLYDPYWSVVPIFIVVLLLVQYPNDVLAWGTPLLILLSVGYWGVRLTHNWYRGWPNLNHEDWRYGKLRKDNPKLALFIDFSGIHLFPTLIVFVAMMPAIWALSYGKFELVSMNYIGIVVFIIAMVFETVGDNQLRDFVKTNTDKNNYLKTGLWQYTRHPNYFGEGSFWWSLYLISWSSEMPWWFFVCPASITAMFVFITGPMMDKRMLEKRPHYEEHMKRTSGFFPWFPKE